MPNRLFVGFDGSKGIGFNPETYPYFVLVAVTCSDKKEAKQAAHSIDKHGKERQLYGKWKRIVSDLIDYDLRYYVLLFDKRGTSLWFRKNSHSIRFHGGSIENRYSAIFDKYAKHGWLIPQIWINWHGKFPSEVRFHPDLSGPAWRLCLQKVKEHAENHVGPCDIDVAGDEYPLIRIAHIIAGFAHKQLMNKSLVDNEPAVIWILKPRCIVTKLITEPDFTMHTEPNEFFTPW